MVIKFDQKLGKNTDISFPTHHPVLTCTDTYTCSGTKWAQRHQTHFHPTSKKSTSLSSQQRSDRTSLLILLHGHLNESWESVTRKLITHQCQSADAKWNTPQNTHHANQPITFSPAWPVGEDTGRPTQDSAQKRKQQWIHSVIGSKLGEGQLKLLTTNT